MESLHTKSSQSHPRQQKGHLSHHAACQKKQTDVMFDWFRPLYATGTMSHDVTLLTMVSNSMAFQVANGPVKIGTCLPLLTSRLFGTKKLTASFFSAIAIFRQFLLHGEFGHVKFQSWISFIHIVANVYTVSIWNLSLEFPHPAIISNLKWSSTLHYLLPQKGF